MIRSVYIYIKISICIYIYIHILKFCLFNQSRHPNTELINHSKRVGSSGRFDDDGSLKEREGLHSDVFSTSKAEGMNIIEKGSRGGTLTESHIVEVIAKVPTQGFRWAWPSKKIYKSSKKNLRSNPPGTPRKQIYLPRKKIKGFSLLSAFEISRLEGGWGGGRVPPWPSWFAAWELKRQYLHCRLSVFL